MSRAATCEGTVAASTEVVDRCPVCAGNEATRLFAARDKLYGLPGRFPVVECGDCGLWYLSERPAPQTLAAYYPADYYAYKPPAAYSLFERTDARAAIWYAIKKSILAHQYGYRHFGGSRFIASLTRLPLLRPLRRHATFALDVLLHPFVEDGSLLEVGCGSGMYLDLMRALGWRRVAGVDISAKAIAQAEAMLGLEVYCGHLNDAGFADESFDAASLSHTLEHVAEPATLLAELHRILKPGGRVAIVVPNAESLAARRFGADWFHLDAPRHLANFTRRSLSLALRRAGFVVETMRTRATDSYEVALRSELGRAGEVRAGGAALPPQPLGRRTRALLLALQERVLCGSGYAAGEELLVAARKPHGGRLI